MHPNLKAICGVGCRLGVIQTCQIDIGSAPDAFPISDRATRSAFGFINFKAALSPTLMVISCHDHHGFFPPWKIPEPRQGLLVEIHQKDQIYEKTLLFVCLWNLDFRQVDPIRLGVKACGAIKQIIRTDRRKTIAVLPGPGRIALTRVDDRSGQVEGKRRRSTAIGADTVQRYRWV